MTKILLLSDTHSFLEERILKYIQWADEVWHAGDIGDFSVVDTLQKYKPLRAVYGNIDDAKIRSEFPLDLIFTIENIKVFITHIGGYPNKYHPRIKPILQKEKPKIFVCGHSHILKIQYDKQMNLLHLNPGACGKNGFHKVKTLIRFGIDKGRIQNMEVIELERRI